LQTMLADAGAVIKAKAPAPKSAEKATAPKGFMSEPPLVRDHGNPQIALLVPSGCELSHSYRHRPDMLAPKGEGRPMLRHFG
jgi:hypothetical protein